LLEDLQPLRRGEVQPAIGLGQEDAEKALAGQVPGEVLGQAAPRLDAIALGQDARTERAGGFQQRRSAAVSVAHQTCCAWKVLQLFTSPLCRPRLNQRTRCALVPCVKLSGTTRPCAWRCRRSSPIAVAAAIAWSTSCSLIILPPRCSLA